MMTRAELTTCDLDAAIARMDRLALASTEDVEDEQRPRRALASLFRDRRDGFGRHLGRYRFVNRQGGSTVFCLTCQPHQPDRALPISSVEASAERCQCSLCQKPLEVIP